MSSTRPRATLADYMVVGISPTLIAFLVGSLVFFLVEVLYQGGFEGRLNFILAMFVMATVCVARISMEEGHAYAATFAAPLALVTGIAMMRFVQISGPLAGLSMLINWGILALIWWSSHKLTWDCTLLDDSTDASGQGLLQNMGLEGEADVDATTSVETTSGDVPQPPWWQTWFANDKRPHTPGVWVIWFSLAALPIFGIGQWFLPPGDLSSRRYVFWLMVIYVGSGLGLLLTTSFLSIRKYLRQRRLEMPVEMAAAWLGVGVAMIGALLLFSFLLPRPNPEYSVAHLPVRFTTPVRGTSPHAVGQDGQKQGPAPQGVKLGQQPGDSQAQQSQTQSASSENQAPKGEGQADKSQAGGDRGSKSADQQAGQSSSEQKQQSDQSAGKSDAQGKQNGQSSGKAASKEQGESSSSSGKSGQQGDGRQKSGEQSSNSNQAKSEQKSPADQAGKSPSPDSKSAEASSSQKPPDDQKQKVEGPVGQQPPPQTSASQSQASGGAAPPPPASAPPISPAAILNSLGSMLQFLGYLAVGLIIAYFAWKYRAELMEAWQKLLAELRELWAKLFGGGVTPETADVPAAPSLPPPRPFAAFANPFASGAAQQMTLAQLVRYTFEALEAWARERNCPRNDGQTPHEFAQYLGQLAPALAGDVKQLADWYGQIAYARLNPPPQAAGVLQQLWRSLV